jgi:uncharacterized membrane protein YedE/YeeE
MGQALVALVTGTLFGAGLLISGMAQPEKIIGFLDVFGEWDPSLVFVMVGAVGVHAAAYRFIRRRPAPLLSGDFHVPTRKNTDVKLLAGAALFGIGWGLSGFCPGPAFVALPGAASGTLVFVAAMLAGIVLAARLER